MPKTSFERARRFTSAVFLCCFVVVAALNRPPQARSLNEIMEIAGLMLLIVAVLGRVWASLYVSGRKNKELCTTGPYSLPRNPLYFASFLGAAGLGLLTESITLAAALILSFLIYYHFIISSEERRLRQLFGADFDAYCREVPRLFPRWRRYRPVDTLVVHTGIFERSILDTSIFLWAFAAFELIEIANQVGLLTSHGLWQLP